MSSKRDTEDFFGVTVLSWIVLIIYIINAVLGGPGVQDMTAWESAGTAAGLAIICTIFFIYEEWRRR